jgi:hypothetical protein
MKKRMMLNVAKTDPLAVSAARPRNALVENIRYLNLQLT